MITFEELYEQYSISVYKRILYLVRSHEMAEELTNDTFVKVWRALPRLEHERNLSGWLFQIATRTAYDVYRKKQHVCFSLDAENAPDIVSEEADPQESYPRRERIVRAWNRLCEDEREVLLAYANGTCTRMEKSRVYRARMKFKRFYHELMAREEEEMEVGA